MIKKIKYNGQTYAFTLRQNGSSPNTVQKITEESTGRNVTGNVGLNNIENPNDESRLRTLLGIALNFITNSRPVELRAAQEFDHNQQPQNNHDHAHKGENHTVCKSNKCINRPGYISNILSNRAMAGLFTEKELSSMTTPQLSDLSVIALKVNQKNPAQMVSSSAAANASFDSLSAEGKEYVRFMHSLAVNKAPTFEDALRLDSARAPLPAAEVRANVQASQADRDRALIAAFRSNPFAPTTYELSMACQRLGIKL